MKKRNHLGGLERITAFPVSRRQVLVGASSLGAYLAMGGSALAKEFDSRTMVFVSWGGAYQDGQKAAYCDPFVSKYGGTVVQDGPMNNPKFRAMVDNGATDWDLVDVTVEFLYSGINDNLFEKLDLSKINTARLSKQYVNDYGIGSIAWSYNIGFNTNVIKLGSHPTSWTEVFDLKKFPGRRLMRDRVSPMMEIALMADGVAPSEVYQVLATDAGVKRAFAKLDTIKENSTWWTTNSQSQQLLVDGETSCGVILNGRVFDAAQKGAAVALDWGQNVQSVSYFVIPRGAKNKDMAHALLDEVTDAANQAKMANLLAYAPTNPEAFATINPEIAPWLSTESGNAAKGMSVDAEFWQTRLEEMTEQWEEWKLS